MLRTQNMEGSEGKESQHAADDVNSARKDEECQLAADGLSGVESGGRDEEQQLLDMCDYGCFGDLEQENAFRYPLRDGDHLLCPEVAKLKMKKESAAQIKITPEMKDLEHIMREIVK